MYILIFLFQLIASGTHIVAKSVTYELHPTVLMLLRAAIAGSLYTSWIFFRRKKLLKIEKKDISKFLLLGLLNIPLNQFLFLTSIRMTSAPNVALAYAMTPVFILLIAVLFFGETASLKKFIGVAIALIGTLIILFERGFDLSSDNFVGFSLVLFASMCYAFYSIIGRELSLKYGAVYTMGLTMIIGFILYLPIFFIFGTPLELSKISAVNWMQIFYLGIITSGVAYALWYYVLTKAEASKVAVFNNLQPLLTTILAIIIFGHELTLPFLAGGLLIICGVVITQRA